MEVGKANFDIAKAVKKNMKGNFHHKYKVYFFFIDDFISLTLITPN